MTLSKVCEISTLKETLYYGRIYLEIIFFVWWILHYIISLLVRVKNQQMFLLNCLMNVIFMGICSLSGLKYRILSLMIRM